MAVGILIPVSPDSPWPQVAVSRPGEGEQNQVDEGKTFSAILARMSATSAGWDS
jgi:hypothetical protein